MTKPYEAGVYTACLYGDFPVVVEVIEYDSRDNIKLKNMNTGIVFTGVSDFFAPMPLSAAKKLNSLLTDSSLW